MTIEDSQPVLPQAEIPHTTLPATRKPRKTVWIIVGVLLVALCVCAVVFIALSGAGLLKVNAERAPVEEVLRAHVQHMANRDAEGAYTFLSPRAQRQVKISEIEEMLMGNNFVLFEGYQSLYVTNISVSAVANMNPDLPQGMVAKVSGEINYKGGIKGSFNGTLEKIDGAWLIYRFSVTVPPEKFE